MITLGKANFDFEAESQPFIQCLYGEWDSFFRVSFEKVVDDVLGRYDNPDELIRIESLTVDMGTLTEDEFREQFPRLLARKLADIFSAYLLNKEAHPEEISVISISHSYLERLSFYLLQGYIRWDGEGTPWDFSQIIQQVLETDKDALCFFLQANGGKVPLRERLVWQLGDDVLEKLTVAVLPSDSSFVTPYIRFLIASHKSLERPEIRVGDYRNIVWMMVWAYLLSESKGYFSRKRFVAYTLQELSAHYNIEFNTLLNLLTVGLKEYVSSLLIVPELLIILSEIRDESPEGNNPESLFRSLSGDELISKLSVSESCRKILNPLSEQEIYNLVTLVIPAESSFIIRYARALDEEKSKGMLEGKAGEDFRLLKWEYMFFLILVVHKDSFTCYRFAYSVLEKLAAHYNLNVAELITYFYESLIQGKVRVDNFVRELITALYVEQMGTILPREMPDSPSCLPDILSNIHLCRRFIEKLSEEEIHMLVKRVLPSESVFVINYAVLLDMEKERGMLEGKAGAEFRVLKWEFIFLVMLSIPASRFNRKDFVHSVLRQLAGHYNLTVTSLILYFYKGLLNNELVVSLEISQLILSLYEDMEIQPVEGLLSVHVETEEMRFCLEDFLITGEVKERQVNELSAFVRAKMQSNPELLLTVVRQMEQGCNPVLLVHTPEAARLFASLLFLVMQSYGLRFPKSDALMRLLENIRENRTIGDADCLRKLLYYCITNRMDRFLAVLNAVLQPDKIVLPEVEPDNSFVKPLGDRTWSYFRLEQAASPALREVAEEVFRLMALTRAGLTEPQWLALLLSLTDRCSNYYSCAGLLLCFWEKLRQVLSEEQQRVLTETIRANEHCLPRLIRIVKDTEPDIPPVTGERPRTYIHNAGLVLLSPYFPRLFTMLDLMNPSTTCLKDREAMVKGIFSLQYLAYGNREFPEYELILNKLLAGYKINTPLPCFLSLEADECKILLSLLKGAMHNWQKMKNTSTEGFRSSFLQRDGVLEELDDRWLLIVEPRAYDVLLDSIPWSYTPVKYTWMEKPLYVKWRE